MVGQGRLSSTRARTRVLATVVAILCFDANVASLIHSLFASHMRCEHGELVDVSAHHHAAHALRATAEVETENTPAQPEQHHHCPYLAAVRARAVTTTPPVAPLALAPVQLTHEMLPVLSPAAQVPLLAQAPKSSPPA